MMDAWRKKVLKYKHKLPVLLFLIKKIRYFAMK